jgi:N-acyl-phosphatidylethanolamine-hydrolysing phospholipase D
MRSFFRTFLRRRPTQHGNKSNNSSQQHPRRTSATQISSMAGMTSAVLYACTTTSPTGLGAVPEDSEAKAHHLKNGKGFTNPWESWKELKPAQIMLGMAW